MRRDFIVERQGRSFVLYAGLLDLAHQQGLRSIRTEMLQVPNAQNNNVAIAMATVTIERDGKERVFTGIGDASPSNVAPAMQTCLIRMSETRAKARALRDAVNVGVAAFEELGEEDAHDGAPERGYQVAGASRWQKTRPHTAPPPVAQRNGTPPPAPKREAPPLSTERVTESQTKAINSLCQRFRIVPDEFAQAQCGVSEIGLLSQTQASDLIKLLNERGRATA